MRKRERRVRKEAGKLGTKRGGKGWAARQAAKRQNRGSRLSKRAIARQKGKG